MRLSYAAVLVISIIFLYSVGVLQPVASVFQKVVLPIQRYFYERNISVPTAEFEKWSRNSLIEEILRLRDEKTIRDQDQIEQKVRDREYDELVTSVDFASRLDGRRVTSVNSVGFGVDQDTSSIVVDAGINRGMIKGLAVTSPTGVLVGIVHDVHEYSSTVNLITHPDAAVAVALEPNGAPSGLVRGRFGLSSELAFVPKDTPIAVGDLVYTSGLDPLIPPGILVGTVETIKQDQNTQFLRGLIQIRFVPASLHIVNVVSETVE